MLYGRHSVPSINPTVYAPPIPLISPVQICTKPDCSGDADLQIDLMAQYAGDGTASADNEQMNCLHADIRSNPK